MMDKGWIKTGSRMGDGLRKGRMKEETDEGWDGLRKGRMKERTDEGTDEGRDG